MEGLSYTFEAFYCTQRKGDTSEEAWLAPWIRMEPIIHSPCSVFRLIYGLVCFFF